MPPPPLHSHAHLQAANIDTQADVCKRTWMHFHTMIIQIRHDSISTERSEACNDGLKKLEVQWLIEHSTSHQYLWWLDGFLLRNRQLLKTVKC